MPLLGVLFTAPTPSQFLSDAGSWSSGFFVELLTIAVVIVGILVAGMITSKLIATSIKAVAKVTGGRKGGRRGRR